ncbi:MAG TPA: GNAT family protein [Blastocatellia bacterium]|nr:GNAT family protein [Blastocatellia bacterium]
MELDLGSLIIREWRVGDEESLVRHANNRKIWLNVRDAFPYPYTMADAVQWVRKAGSDDPLTSFAIVIDGEAVGGIGVVLQQDVFRRSAEIGYWLSEGYWGRGIVTRALRAMTDYAFANFDLCRIYAGVFEWNPASMRVLEKCGYQLEGRMKKAVIKDGTIMDDFIYAITR